MTENIIDFESAKDKNSATDKSQQTAMSFTEGESSSDRKPYLVEDDGESICLCCKMKDGSASAVPYSHLTYTELDRHREQITLYYHNIGRKTVIKGRNLEILFNDLAQHKVSKIIEKPETIDDKDKSTCSVYKITRGKIKT